MINREIAVKMSARMKEEMHGFMNKAYDLYLTTPVSLPS